MQSWQDRSPATRSISLSLARHACGASTRTVTGPLGMLALDTGHSPKSWTASFRELQTLATAHNQPWGRLSLQPSPPDEGCVPGLPPCDVSSTDCNVQVYSHSHASCQGRQACCWCAKHMMRVPCTHLAEQMTEPSAQSKLGLLPGHQRVASSILCCPEGSIFAPQTQSDGPIAQVLRTLSPITNGVGRPQAAGFRP